MRLANHPIRPLGGTLHSKNRESFYTTFRHFYAYHGHQFSIKLLKETIRGRYEVVGDVDFGTTAHHCLWVADTRTFKKIKG